MSKSESDMEILIAKRNAVVNVGGHNNRLRKDITHARRGHPIVKGREHWFVPVEERIDFDLPKANEEEETMREATASEPGQTREATAEPPPAVPRRPSTGATRPASPPKDKKAKANA